MRGPGGPSRASSGVPIRTPGAVTAGRRTVLPSQERRRVCLAQRRWSVMQQVSPSRGGADHRGGCGASRLNTARGTPWVWRTCGTLCLFARTRVKGEAHRTSTSLDVARRRGPRVQLDPGVPRALGSSSGRCGSSRTRRRTRRRKETGRRSFARRSLRRRRAV